MTVAHRSSSLRDLSGGGRNYVGPEQASKYPVRARNVDVGGAEAAPDSLRQLGRLMRLHLRRCAPPSWLGELIHLRALSIATPSLERLPAAVFDLPRLKELYLDGSRITDLAGIERSPRLERVFIAGTPLEDDRTAIEKLLAAGFTYDGGFLNRKVVPAAAPKAKAALVRALQESAVDDSADLRSSDLSGGAFEDLLVRQDFTGANLSKTVWKRCDFSRCKLDDANLTDARFEDCTFDMSYPEAEGVSAPGVTFERCALSLAWPGADLRGARFIDLEDDPSLDFEKAKASKMELSVRVTEESSLKVNASGADLRGARIVFDIEPSRREELEANPNPRLRWGKAKLTKAKTDDATQIVYTPLPTAEKKAAKKASATKDESKPLFDRRGKRAELISRIDANNAALWVLAIDAAQATPWKGSENGDFDRAMAVDEGTIDVGDHQGMICQIGDCGWSYVWRIAGGVALVSHYPSGHATEMKKNDFVPAMGARVAQFPVQRAKRLGQLTIESGCLAILLPHAKGDFTAAQRRDGAKGDGAALGDRVLVPLKKGAYEVLSHPFAPEVRYEDELGRYGDCIRIVRV